MKLKRVKQKDVKNLIEQAKKPQTWFRAFQQIYPLGSGGLRDKPKQRDFRTDLLVNQTPFEETFENRRNKTWQWQPEPSAGPRITGHFPWRDIPKRPPPPITRGRPPYIPGPWQLPRVPAPPYIPPPWIPDWPTGIPDIDKWPTQPGS